VNCIRTFSAFFDCFEIDCKPVVDKVAIGDFSIIDVDNFFMLRVLLLSLFILINFLN